MTVGQREFLAYVEKMLDAYETLSDEEQAALETWEREHVTGDGTYGTTDWPGWEPHIGRSPGRGEVAS